MNQPDQLLFTLLDCNAVLAGLMALGLVVWAILSIRSDYFRELKRRRKQFYDSVYSNRNLTILLLFACCVTYAASPRALSNVQAGYQPMAISTNAPLVITSLIIIKPDGSQIVWTNQTK